MQADRVKSRAGIKKGILFSILTIMLLYPIFSFSMFYISLSGERESNVFSFDGEKIRYFDSDISETYFDLLGINISEFRRYPNKIKIKFEPFYNISNYAAYSVIIENYESFIENFSSLAKANANLDLTPNFNVSPYNISFRITDNYLYVYTDSPEMIQTISIVIKVNKLQENITDSGSPSDAGGDNPQISVVIKDNNGAAILSQSPRLNVSSDNNPFYILFNDSSRIDVDFGLYSSRNGTVVMQTTSLQAQVSEMEMEYDVKENVFMQGEGNYYIEAGGINKTKLVLAYE